MPVVRLKVGEWEVDSARNGISRGGETVRLEPKVIEILAYLCARSGEVAPREELLSAVWPGVVVGDDALTQAIIKLRKALGDDAHKPTYIETISKRGYRLIAPVEALPPADGTAPGAAGGRRLAAILSADIAGYSRLMDEDEAATVKTLKEHQAAILPFVGRFEGRVIDLAGDGILAEFPSALGAVECALEIQRVIAEANAKTARSKRLQFRIGVNVGDVIHDDKRIYGDGINIAARIQALASPGGLIVSRAVFEQVRNKIPIRFVGLGAVALKNIREPMQVYQALPSGARASAWLERSQFALRTRQGLPTGAFITLALLLTAAVAIPTIGGWIRMPWPLGADTRGAVTASMPVVAILPFANLSGDPKREYFSDGLTEDIITGLGRFSGLRVMSVNAVQGFKGKTATLATLQAELGARYIVKGSIREADRQLRVAVEMSDAEKGGLLWSERYEGEGSQLFEIQDRIVRNIVGALHVKLTQLEQQRAFRRPTENLEAYDLVLRARSLNYQRDRRLNREARALLSKARELAPDYGEVLNSQGEAERDRALYGWVEDPADSMKKAEDLAQRALANADARVHARAHSLLSSINSNRGRLEEALRHADLALAANPSDASALYARAAVLLFTGRIDESIAAHEAARRIQPDVGNYAGNFAHAYYAAGRHGEALALVDTMLTRYPNDVSLRAIRTAALSQLGREDEARKAADDVRRLSPGFEVRKFAMRIGDQTYRAKVHEGLTKAGME